MKRIAFSLALLLAAAGPAGAQNTGLERLGRPDQVTSWKAVGRVDVGGVSYCTGTLIAADLVLTAAHCLFDRSGMPHDVTRITFRAGYADGVSIAESKVSRAVPHADYQPSKTGLINGEQILRDVALLQLAQPVSTAEVPPFAVTSPGDGDRVSVVSYGEGRSEALSWQRACTVLGRRYGLIAVDCDVTFGSSGAPVFDRSQGRARIVSIVSGGAREGARSIALGMELPGLVSELKAQLRAGRGVLEGVASAAPGMRRISVGAGERAGGARFIRAPGN